MSEHLTLSIGKSRLVVDPDKITLKKIKDLAKDVTEIKLKNSIFSRIPMKDGESPEEYQKRVNEELQDKPVAKKENESSEEYVKRILNPMENHSVVFELLKAIATAFGQEKKVTEEDYDETPYVKAKEFVNSVLSYCDLL